MLDALSKGETVGERIAYYRKKKKLSQQQLADLAGVSVCTIKRIERNKIISGQNTYRHIIDALQVNSSLIYDDYFSFINSNYDQYIKNYRNQNKLTQLQLSKILHIHVKTIMRWEQKKSFPSIQQYNLIKLLLSASKTNL